MVALKANDLPPHLKGAQLHLLDLLEAKALTDAQADIDEAEQALAAGRLASLIKPLLVAT